ncbi:uncharacterized protein M421DRAFT_96054 [Didymella exigua CBS 183.55]|uniref:Uncharacterized protein n=1 Tax=Didymella exigua CBS 183.55 TaxID=1150837 RepID=A0A6A5R859_9PLEO|nr:uncharacterized protein M421DRAFT_96054 [Didymella exigua CBS 183.55]KAF1923499.1 hypothetical protein M421DRAFT_96054 [Didymella exigua CBS 183.55]
MAGPCKASTGLRSLGGASSSLSAPGQLCCRASPLEVAVGSSVPTTCRHAAMLLTSERACQPACATVDYLVPMQSLVHSALCGSTPAKCRRAVGLGTPQPPTRVTTPCPASKQDTALSALYAGARGSVSLAPAAVISPAHRRPDRPATCSTHDNPSTALSPCHDSLLAAVSILRRLLSATLTDLFPRATFEKQTTPIYAVCAFAVDAENRYGCNPALACTRWQMAFAVEAASALPAAVEEMHPSEILTGTID